MNQRRESSPPSAAELEECIDLLEALAADRLQLQVLPPERRRALLIAAGRLSRPLRHEVIVASKAVRRDRRAARRQHDARIFAATEIRQEQRSSTYVPPSLRLPAGDDDLSTVELNEPRACYVCKDDFRRVHFFYHSMCPPCARLNYAKRGQTARLDGRVALVTGARLKIGYQIALMLLRAGARVIATTRFPRDAALRFAAEADHAAWGDRLELHGLDLRHAPSVELFAGHLERTLPGLDFVINNAAQTVRRPVGFYTHLMRGERRPTAELPEAARPLLAANDALRAEFGAAARDEAPGLVVWNSGDAAAGLLASAELSQLPLTPDDLEQHHFPDGLYDQDLQQVDRRTMNSWRLTLADVPTAELLEVHLVNAIAPFILNSRLKPLMTRQRTDDKHVVNVSAMEAQFSRNKKTERHPHTNMAKAALNMMTRTSAVDYARAGIFMNSVDTGWVTDEDPLHHVDRKQEVHDFFPPLDAVDGAARVLDPIFTGFNSGHHMWGLFLKDYRPVEW
jgi:NAD(P)-dependent dehydrogenase (short-subunit alcohol dehydrogenase family)